MLAMRWRRLLAYGTGWAVVVGVALAASALLDTELPLNGPLAFDRLGGAGSLVPGVTTSDVLDLCFPARSSDDGYKVVAGRVDGEPFFACYEVSGSKPVSAEVLDRGGHFVGDADLMRRAGVSAWVEGTTTRTDLAVFTGFALGPVIAFGALWLLVGTSGGRHRRSRIAGAIVVGLVLGLGALVVSLLVFQELERPEPVGLLVSATLLGAFVYGFVAGRSLVLGLPLLDWLVLDDPRLRTMSYGLLGSLAAFPFFVVGLVFLAALGNQNVTDTMYRGIVVVATVGAALATVAVSTRWLMLRHELTEHGTVVPRIGVVQSTALGTAGLAAAAVVLAAFYAVPEFTSFLNPGFTKPKPGVVQLIQHASGKGVKEVKCAAGVCAVQFDDTSCELWRKTNEGVERVGALPGKPCSVR